MALIKTARVVAPDTYEFVVNAPRLAKKALPGQFVIVRLDEHAERIPLTIADYDREGGTITLVFQAVGRSTKDLAELKTGDNIQDLVGPLGVPSHLPESGTVIIIGGGVGVAPVYPMAKWLHAHGARVVSIIGARSKNLLIMEDQMRAVSDELHVTTDDGSYGRKGFVTDVLKDLLATGEPVAEVVAIGPVVMMRSVVRVTKELNVKTTVSLNAIMVDGTGMCGACRVTVGGKTRFTCVDGPDFDGLGVDFDELMRRQAMYKPQEKAALEARQCCGGVGSCLNS